MEININPYLDTLVRMPIFSGFTKEDLNRVFSLRQFAIEEYDKGQIVHLKNEKCDSMDIILNGKVTVQNIDENGNVLIIEVFTGGDLVGANLMFSKKNVYPMTVTAASETTILRLQRELILKLCRSSENFMIGLLSEISNKTIILTNKINTISLKTIRQCIIDFLKSEHYLQKSNVIRLNMSKKDLAERLGIQRTSLSRELNKMRKDGLLEYDASTITLLKMDIFKS